MGVLDSYEPITLDQMADSKLMDRVDTKYVTTRQILDAVLALASSDYYVLYTGGSPVSRYDTLYFDTEGLDMYMMHQNGRLNRTKVRTRTYVNTGESYLEIKRKNNHKRTKKKRILIPSGSFGAPFGSDASAAFLREKSGYEAEGLSPALSTNFTRITLVAKQGGERITIDYDLLFKNFRNGAESGLGPAVIMELKRSSNIVSPMTHILQDLRIHPFRVSKYCIGTAKTDPDIKQNRFKNKLRYINRLSYASTNIDAGL